MCIIIGEIEKVSATKIFVGQMPNKKQFTVYSNKINTPKHKDTNNTSPFLLPSVNSKDDNNVAMILPVPTKELNDIQIVDMSEYKNMFKDLKYYFPSSVYLNGARTRGFVAKSVNSFLPITVHGSYDVTIVPSLEEFYRLKYDHFVLKIDAIPLFQKNYSENFGFIVCRIRDDAEYHPFGYTHSLYEDDKLFIPTKHYHNNSEDHADWDHEIYVAGGDINRDTKLNGMKIRVGESDSALIPKLPVKLVTDKVSDLHQITISRMYDRNHDFMINVKKYSSVYSVKYNTPEPKERGKDFSLKNNIHGGLTRTYHGLHLNK